MMTRFKQNYRLLERVRLLAMPHDPDPVAVGTEGTIIGASATEVLGVHYQTQLHIKWDNGRTLYLLPEDSFAIVSPMFTSEHASVTKADVLDQIDLRTDEDVRGFRSIGDIDLDRLTDDRMRRFVNEWVGRSDEVLLALAKDLERP